MKLWYSFIKELKLSSKSYYFYIELFMAIIFLTILLFVIPEKFSSKTTEYISYDLPKPVANYLVGEILKNDLDGQVEKVEFKRDDETVIADYYETDEKKIYIFEDKETMITMTEAERPLVGAHLTWDKDLNEIHYEYYLQGYESERLKNLYLIIHNEDLKVIKTLSDNQEVRSLSTGYDTLNDREMVVPSFLTFNGSLMGLFIIVAYIFLDKQEGIIKAYAVTASKVWHYLMSKVLVLLVVSTISSFIITVPVMGFKPNYLLLLILLITLGFFASSLGLVVASFYKNMMQSFGAIYFLMIVMLLPNIAYFIPSWEPIWIKVIPTYPLIQGFKETIVRNGDIAYTLIVSLGFLVVGAFLFIVANYRYKKTLAS